MMQRAVVSVVAVQLTACATSYLLPGEGEDVGAGSVGDGDGEDATTSTSLDSSGAISAAGEESDESDTGAPGPSCNDGVIEAPEECEGEELGGLSCADFGYAEGTLGCDPLTCTFDMSDCRSSETLANHDGRCTDKVGCTNPTGNSGNPQDLVECFTSTLEPPLTIREVTYAFVGDTIPLPGSASVVVWGWSGSGAPSGALATFELDPAGDIVSGPNAYLLPEAVVVDRPTFCVGLLSLDQADGFRAHSTPTPRVEGVSWLRAPVCGYSTFTTTASPDLSTGNWCFEAVVERWGTGG